MRVRVILIALCGLHVAACDTIPRDPAGTSERVAETGVIRLGAIEGAQSDPDIDRALAALSDTTGARVERITGPGEALLKALEKGELDLVYGRFADDSPWRTHIHLGTPPDGTESRPKSLRLPRFAMRNGENEWIMTVENVVKP